MNTVSRFYQDYEIGAERATLGRTITETDIVIHAGQTGDFFPHHMDAEWSATQEFGERIAHGTLVLSVAVGMTASEINTEAFSYGYDRIRFIRAVRIGDTLTVTASITGLRDHPRRQEHGIVEETVTATNQHGEAVLSLVHLYMVNKRDHQ
ncbi:dehydratase [Nakamurella antarctica]|uniref:Dehydratase n=1 Tax=Nakamurella antarctica TaxID=1902245 RepID=A0A3G8ZI86_9ACTN|nr:MaoC/PaaZ C-terminal domain-containing protein [Nakamurella antarctica]AZI56930.1 dehydratase [Nakamurella antarctica]